MRSWVFAWMAAVGSIAPIGTLGADPPRTSTSFKFEVRFSDGVQTYNENQGAVVNVWLPPDQGWQCLRLGVTTVEGRQRASFACSSDNWRTEVLTMVGCKAGEPDPLRTAGMRLFAPRADGRPQGAPGDAGVDAAINPMFGKYVDLAASCETVSTR